MLTNEEKKIFVERQIKNIEIQAYSNELALKLENKGSENYLIISERIAKLAGNKEVLEEELNIIRGIKK